MGESCKHGNLRGECWACFDEKNLVPIAQPKQPENENG